MQTRLNLLRTGRAVRPLCFAGGQKEVGILAPDLAISRKTRGMNIEIREHTLERQRDHE